MPMQYSNTEKVAGIPQAPSLLKLGACLMYDALVVVALSFASVLVFILVFGDASDIFFN